MRASKNRSFHLCRCRTLLSFLFSQFSSRHIPPGPARPFCRRACSRARTYDWHIDHGLLIVNKKGVAKRAMLLNPAEKAAEWVSKYGSVTFNQYGREMPNGGMNEVGLVVETLMLPSTQNPAAGRPACRDGLAAVPARQQPDGRGGHRQRQDNSDLPGDADADPLLRLRRPGPCRGRGVHRAARWSATRASKLPHKLITNDTCDDSLAYPDPARRFRRDQADPQGLARIARPLRRRRRPAQGLPARRTRSNRRSSTPSTPSRRSAKATATKWSIVYDLKNLEIHYKTERCAETRTVRLKRPRLQLADPGPHGQHQHAAHGRPEPALHRLRRRSEQLDDLLLRAAHAHARPDPGRAPRPPRPLPRDHASK